MRLLLKILGVLLLLVLIAAAVVYFIAAGKLGERYTPPASGLMVQASTEAQARGEYLSYILGCHDCHGDNLGGNLMGDAPPFRLDAPNLTPGEGGVGGHYTGADWARAVRHGVGHDGRALYIMPAKAYRHLSDADMAALAAYLDNLPPVEGAHAGVQFKPLGRALLAFGAVENEVVNEPISITAPPMGPTAEYGGYLATLCAYCHGEGLTGAPNPEPGGKPVPSLRPVAQWTRAQFASAIQEGFVPDGRRLDPQQMPWTAFSHMSESDVAALYNYIRQLESLPADTTGMPVDTTAMADTTMTSM